MTIEIGRSISGDHPSLPHHFPGDPVVPGVVILSEVIAALLERHPGYWVSGLSRVKFNAPLKPAQHFTIRLIPDLPGRADFECESDGALLAQGRLLLSPLEGAP